MKYIVILTLLLTTSFNTTRTVKASYYDTTGTAVHREYPTAAMNGVPRYSKFEVTNTRNGKSCVVTITDRMHPRMKNNIDLSKQAFGLIEDHKRGVCLVTVTKFDEQ